MKTRYLVRFLGDSAYMDSDLELIDVIQQAILNKQVKTNSTKYIFDHIDPKKHTKLAKWKSSDHSRSLASHHLKNSLRAAYIKSLYEATTNYFQDVLKASAQNILNVDQLVGEHSMNFTNKELLSLGSFEKIIEKISLSIFRQLENERSTKSLIEKMHKKLGLSINEHTISSALPYLEIRHLLVHSQGVADKEFSKSFPSLKAKENKPIRLSYDLIDNARKCITDLIVEFDNQLIEKNLVKREDLQP